MHKTFRYLKFSDRPKCSQTKLFGTVRQKNFDGESRYSLSPLIQKFSVPEITETLKRPPTKVFGTVRQKIFDEKSRYSLPPLFQTFSIPENNETLKDSPKTFSAL